MDPIEIKELSEDGTEYQCIEWITDKYEIVVFVHKDICKSDPNAIVVEVCPKEHGSYSSAFRPIAGFDARPNVKTGKMMLSLDSGNLKKTRARDIDSWLSLERIQWALQILGTAFK